MKRNVDIREISDGKRYGLNDMVKADCKDCTGCSACCSGMGNSIVLDPMDLYRLTRGLGVGFQDLMNGYIELNVVDGVILPNLKLKGEEERCAFLSDEGRCRIHSIRPGICRLFPLGRLYREDGSGFDYILQIHECRHTSRSKIKVKKWIDTPDLKQYEAFVMDWHRCLEKIEKRVKEQSDEAAAKALIMKLLTLFYVQPYDGQRDFYAQFYERLGVLEN